MHPEPSRFKFLTSIAFENLPNNKKEPLNKVLVKKRLLLVQLLECR